MKSMNHTQEVNTEAMKNVVGAGVWAPHGWSTICEHPCRRKTGEEREDPRFIFWSQHQYEYICPDCGKIWWKNEERC